MSSLALARESPRWLLPLLLAGLATLGPFSIDAYMPSFPAIGQSLGATRLQVQQTLASYLFAFAVMMLFHGALSDSFGRRPVILASLVVYAAASLGCVLSFDLRTLFAFRVLQGISAGAGMVVGRAMIRDRYSGHDAQRVMSQVSLYFGLAPAVAPIIGGWLQVLFGWHSVFAFLALLGVALLLVCARFLPETLPPADRQPFHPIPLAIGYKEVLGSRSFLLLAAAVGLNFAAFFLYIASAPAFVLRLLKLGETQFGWLFLPGIAGIMLGAFGSGRLAGRLHARPTVRCGYALMGTAAVVNILYASLSHIEIPWAVLPILLYTTGMSLAMPTISLLILDLFPLKRGLAASLQGFAATAINAVVAGTLSPWLSGSGWSLALGMACLAALGSLCWAAFSTLEPGRATHGHA